ncbi:peptidase S8/S53 domain-containing protein [Syncephalis plumigaleata]|nr:peptidase S8/S53 domain-containing protein [Syncephalis plumigaleata]
MHIINISANTLDNREGFYAKLLEEYHRKNIIIIVSSGNIVEGMNLAWSSRLFGNSPHTVSVGSLDLRYDEQRYFTIAGKETIPVPYKSACTMNSLLINDLNLFTITPEMISCSLPFNVRGKAVLVASNKCNINVLLANAKKVGAGGVIIRQPINLLDNCPLPVIGLSEASFKTMVNLMEKQPNPTLQFSSDTMLAPDTRPILNDMRTFWGPSVELGLNPNVIAPGKIMFTTTAKDKGYKVADGTSFASPYVAGSAALFLQYHAKSNVIPRFPPSIFQALIQSTALPT